MLYIQVSESDFLNAFERVGRDSDFSIPAQRALFNYYDELSDDCGEDIELDVVAICCEWGEYTREELFDEFRDNVIDEFDPDEVEDGEIGEDEIFDAIIDHVNDNGYIIEVEHHKMDDAGNFYSEYTWLVQYN